MKKLIIICLFLYISFSSASQNVGIGVPVPLQKLDVNGAIKIGTSATNQSGTIRYNGGNVEGGNGSNWKSFTQQPSGTLVASTVHPNAALINSGFSFFAPSFVNKSITLTNETVTCIGVHDFNSHEAGESYTSLWTGTEMIIYGRSGESGSSVMLNYARYIVNSETNISTVNQSKFYFFSKG